MERMEMDVMMIRINACMQGGRYAEARRLLERVLEEEPAHGVAHGMLGWMCWSLVEDHERALMHFRNAVRWAPGHVTSWMHYLGLLAGDGLEEELHGAYHRALGVAGIDRTEVHLLVARYLDRTGRRAEALTVYRSALRSGALGAAESEARSAIARIRARMRRAWLARVLG